MKTLIAEPISYNGWTIKLYLENFGFSFQAIPPECLPFDPLEDEQIYPTLSKARVAAKRLINADMVTLSLELFLAEMYQVGRISSQEHESLCNSLLDAFWVEGEKA